MEGMGENVTADRDAAFAPGITGAAEGRGRGEKGRPGRVVPPAQLLGRAVHTMERDLTGSEGSAVAAPAASPPRAPARPPYQRHTP